MKNILFIGLGLLIYSSLFSQNYHSFDTSSVWIIENEYVSVIPPYYTTTYGLFIAEDTIINTKTYKKVKSRGAWSSNTGVINMGGQIGTTYTSHLGMGGAVLGAIREDSLKRVYYYDFGSMGLGAPFPNTVFPVGQEVLLYDFGKTVGDSILQYFSMGGTFDTTYIHITAIDSIQLNDNSFRKRLHLKGATSSQAIPNDSVFYYWVEGIGVLGRPNTLNISAGWYCDSEGLLGGRVISPATNLAAAARERRIRCFSNNHIKLFGSNIDSTSFCDTLPPNLLDLNRIQPIEQVQLRLFPNPFQQQTTLQIEGIEYNNLEIQLINATGQVVRQIKSTKKEITIYKNDLPVGVYFYKVWADKRAIGTGKLIVSP